MQPYGERSNVGNDDDSLVNEIPPAQPTFSSDLNYFQNDTIKTTTSLVLNSNFTNTLYLRGKNISNYITGTPTTINCLVVNFPASVDNKLLVFALSPKSIINLSNNTREYYYQISTADKSYNQTHCQTAGMLNQLDTTFPTATVAYSLADLCPNCSTEQYLYSSSLDSKSTAGSSITAFSISYLGITLVAKPYTSNNDENVSCKTDPECISRDYNCCSYGQCVNDGALKNGVDQTSSDYLQSQADIASNPLAFKNYPEFYHICATAALPTPAPTPSISAEVSEQIRFNELKEIYQCTTLLDGEMSLCTTTYPSIGTSLSGTYTTLADDRSFSSIYTGTNGTTLGGVSLYKVEFAGKTLYANKALTEANAFTIAGSNDNLSDSTRLIFNNYPWPSSASNSDLKITYMVDGSCKKTSTTSALCEKRYLQGQNKGKVSDHYPVTNSFKIPYYADTTRTIKVVVDGMAKESGLYWNLAVSGGSYSVAFIGPELKVFDSQEVVITYYVDLVTYPNLMLSKNIASAKLQQMCGCSVGGCWLEPYYDDNNSLANYLCTYPETTLSTTLDTTVYVNAKAVPHLYFDQSGVYQKTILANSTQEGNKFAYTNNDLLKPNNDGTYIGFNEIYGSISTNLNGARPAVAITVARNANYDIYVDSGTFSTCYYCGTDYYSNLAKIFPGNFTYRGGGYEPDGTTSNKSKASIYRADDLLYGRACFIPATMIPWAHQAIADTNAQSQRLHRLQAQHFLFANGYQRDWFGFDYGSLIGSFDGVRWFSIGNQRRIKATSNKLFLAINGYFGDLTATSDFKVRIVDGAINPLTESTITTDFDSDGASCQKYHLCENDSDCVTQLGWDYTCQNVSAVSSKWPIFDNNGQEVPGQEQFIRLLSLVGNGAGTNKRCVYRGRGTPCHADYSVTDSSQTFDNTDLVGMHGCSSNNYCQAFNDVTLKKLFNNKISRWGKSVAAKNAANQTTENTFGLGVKIIGRPYAYNGAEEVETDVISQFANNNFDSLCIPGRSPASWGLTLLQQNSYQPNSLYGGDQVSGVGMSLSGINAHSEYLSSCPTLNEYGNFYHLQRDNLNSSLAASELINLAASQSLPSNSLSIFESILNGQAALLSDFISEQVTRPQHQENRCLRAPGSPCFSDMECGPSSFISTQLASMVADDSSYVGILNKYEINFWKEALICGQSDSLEHTFSLKENRCCRETSKILTIPTYFADSDLFAKESVPGVDTGLSSAKRYSGNSVIYNEVQSGTLPTLEAAYPDQCSASSGCMPTSTIQNQYAAFSAMASKMCCTGHWVRNFHDSNGGGHKWHHSKAQKIDLEAFRCLNWLECVDPANQCPTQFSCAHASSGDDGDCLINVTDNTSAEVMFDWLNRLELAGIPQIPVRKTLAADDDLMCKVDPNNQETAGTTYIPETARNTTAEYRADTIRYYSAADTNNFSSNIKMIFSPDKISCCVPAGETVKASDSADRCCTGFKTSDNRCALEDYTNVSLYFNRYVSSAANGLSDALFDPETGFFKSAINAPSTALIQLACYNNVCASGKLAQGITLSNLKIPGLAEGAVSNKKKRYLDGHDDASNNYNGLADLYDIGLRWSNDLYCIPADLESDSDNNVKIYDCSNY